MRTTAELLGRWAEVLESALRTLRHRARNEDLTVAERLKVRAIHHRVLDRLENVERQEMEALGIWKAQSKPEIEILPPIEPEDESDPESEEETEE